VSPWVLVDFRSPRRFLPEVQNFHNRKGLVSYKRQKKQAFMCLRKYYDELKWVLLAGNTRSLGFARDGSFFKS
jgi:hypothetical protein